MVFLQFIFPANLAQLVVLKMHCHYANAAVQMCNTDHIRWYDKGSYLM